MTPYVIKFRWNKRDSLWVAVAQHPNAAIELVKNAKAGFRAYVSYTGLTLLREHQTQLGLTDGSARPLAEEEEEGDRLRRLVANGDPKIAVLNATPRRTPK